MIFTLGAACGLPTQLKLIRISLRRTQSQPAMLLAGSALAGIGIRGSIATRSFRVLDCSTARSAGDFIHPSGPTTTLVDFTGRIIFIDSAMIREHGDPVCAMVRRCAAATSAISILLRP